MLEVEVVPPGVSREPCIAIHGSAGGVRRIRHIGERRQRLPTQRACGEQYKEQGRQTGNVHEHGEFAE